MLALFLTMRFLSVVTKVCTQLQSSVSKSTPFGTAGLRRSGCLFCGV
jgi:hypothetical protein